MQIDVLAPSDLTAQDRAAWRAFQAADAELASPYLSPDWVDILNGAGGPDARHLKVLRLRLAGEALGFLAVRAGAFTAMAPGAPFCDYMGLVAAPGLRVDPRDLVRALKVARLDLHNVPSTQVVFADRLQGLEPSHIVDLSQGFDAYVAERKAAGVGLLQDCAKKARKFEREVGPLSFEAMSTDEAAFDQLFAWKIEQLAATGQPALFAPAWPLAMMREVFARREVAVGGALFTLKTGDQLLAANLCFRAPGVLHVWMIAHDDAHSRYSTGLLLIADILRWAGSNGVREIDFGPGDYRFKQQLANRQRLTGHGFVGLTAPATLVRAAEYRLRGLAEALPLGRYSELPGKAMRRLDRWRALRPA
jgi:CelD/BcsL family acetyltransferase involved in cellulose biosynthesis